MKRATLQLAETEGVTVDCAPEVMDEICRLAVEGFNAFPYGGLETGGVLYGVREDDRITVVSFATLECRHVMGPSFVLSEDDHATLGALLSPPAGLETVGWFRSRTRSSLRLDAGDREMFDRYFGRHGSVALLLKPAASGAVERALFLRTHSGEVESAAVSNPGLEHTAQQRAVAVSRTLEPPGAPLPGGRTLAIAVAALILLASLVIWSRPTRKIGLRISAISPGQVRIQWNRHSKPVLEGASGVLEIRDGDSSTRVPLDAEGIRSSTVTYSQRTDRITARLLLFPKRPGGLVESDAIEFAGPVPPAAARAAVRTEIPPAPTAAVVKSEEEHEQPALDTVVRVRVKLPAPELRVREGFAERRSETALLPAPPAVGPNGFSQNPLAALLPPIAPHSAPTLPPPSKSPAYTGPRTGRLIWTGSLPKRGVVEIDGGRTSIGSLIGSLPGVPLSIRVTPSEFSRGGLVAYTSDPASAGRREAPSKSNGWNDLFFELDAERAQELEILETPNATNDFSRLVVRNAGRPWPVVLIEWAVH